MLEIACLIVVAILWGATNPFLKKNTRDIVKVKADSRLKQFLMEVRYLSTNTRYLVPMGLNQLGSMVYFITLQNVDLSLSVPLANSLTFVFTAISGWILGERLPGRSTIIGILLILLGTFLCCYDNHFNNISNVDLSFMNLLIKYFI